MTEKLLQEQNKMLKGLLAILVELLPRHAADCYGLQVHPRNRSEYCNCKMSEVREKVRGL